MPVLLCLDVVILVSFDRFTDTFSLGLENKKLESTDSSEEQQIQFRIDRINERLKKLGKRDTEFVPIVNLEPCLLVQDADNNMQQFLLHARDDGLKKTPNEILNSKWVHPEGASPEEAQGSVRIPSCTGPDRGTEAEFFTFQLHSTYGLQSMQKFLDFAVAKITEKHCKPSGTTLKEECVNELHDLAFHRDLISSEHEFGTSVLGTGDYFAGTGTKQGKTIMDTRSFVAWVCKYFNDRDQAGEVKTRKMWFAFRVVPSASRCAMIFHPWYLRVIV